MTIQELYINNRSVDLEANTTIALNFQVNDLAELADRNATFSNTIKIPKTASNKLLFEFLGVTGNLSLVPYKEVRARLTVSTFEVVTNGVIAVQDASATHYRVVIIDGIASFKSAIDGKDLKDIDFSDLDHYMTRANISTSQILQEYVYAVADFRDDSFTYNDYDTTNKTEANTMLPSVYFSEIFSRIFSQAGFTFNGFFQSKDIYQRQALACTGKFTNDHFIASHWVEVYNAGDPSTYQEYVILGDPNPNPITLEILANEETLFSGGGMILLSSPVNTYYNVPRTSKYSAKILVRVEQMSSSFDIDVQVEVNAVVVATPLTFNGTIISGDIPVELEGTATFDAEEGDTIEITQKLTRAGTLARTVRYSKVRVEINEVTENRVLFDSFIDIARRLPDMSQFDFIKIVMQQFALVPIPQGDSHIHFAHIGDILRGAFMPHVDWTNKFASETKEQYKLGDYGKTNLLKYKYKSSTDTFADGDIALDVFALPSEKTLFTSKANMVREETGKDTLAVPKIEVFKESLEEIDDGFGGMIAKRFVYCDPDGKPYVLLIEAHTLNARHEIVELDDDDPPASVGTIVYLAGTSNLKLTSNRELYWENFIEDYYSEFQQVNNRAQKKTLKVLLDILDIKSLDFRKLIYFKQFQAFFYLNKIKNWRNGQLCEIEVVNVSKSNDLTLCDDTVPLTNQQFFNNIFEDGWIDAGFPTTQVQENPCVIESSSPSFIVQQDFDHATLPSGANDYLVRFKAVRRKDGVATSLQLNINGTIIFVKTDRVIVYENTHTISRILPNNYIQVSVTSAVGPYSYELHYIELCLLKK